MKTNYSKLLKTSVDYLNYAINYTQMTFEVKTMKTEFGHSIWIVEKATKRSIHICRCEDAKTAYKMVMTFIDGYNLGYAQSRKK